MRTGRRDEIKKGKDIDRKLKEKRGEKGKTLTRGKKKSEEAQYSRGPEALLRERMRERMCSAGWEPPGGFNDSCRLRGWTEKVYTYSVVR